MELRSMKSKVKLKGQVTSQQDTMIQEKQAAIEKGLSEISNLQEEVNRLKLENESLKKKVCFPWQIFKHSNLKKLLVISWHCMSSLISSETIFLVGDSVFQSEELQGKLDEAQELVKSNQQMIQ